MAHSLTLRIALFINLVIKTVFLNNYQLKSEVSETKRAKQPMKLVSIPKIKLAPIPNYERVREAIEALHSGEHNLSIT